MTVEKTFGFTQASPYRSETFNRFSDLVFGRNGLIKRPLSISIDWGTRVLSIAGGFTFLQNGMIVSRTNSLIDLALPEGLVAPFYLIATTPDNIVRENVIVSFAKTPQEINLSHAVISYYDGVEWRYPDILDVDGLVRHREYSNVVYNHKGFNNGLLFSHDNSFSNYFLSSGDITDKQGHLNVLLDDRTFSAIPEDPDYSRIDILAYRRPADNYERMGLFELLPGLCMSSTRSAQLEQQVLGGASTNTSAKILIAADNKAYVLYASDMSLSSGSLYYTCISANRSVVEIAPTVVAFDMALGMFDATIDSNGDIAIAYIAEAANDLGGSLKFLSIRPDATIRATSTFVEDDSVPYYTPYITTDLLGYHHIFVHASVSTTDTTIKYVKVSFLGEVSIPFKELMPGTTVKSFSIVANPEGNTHVAYVDAVDDIVHYNLVDNDGELVPYSLVTLTTGSLPQVYVTANKEVFVSFLSAGKLYFSNLHFIWKQEPYDITDITYYKCVIDTHNNAHIQYTVFSGVAYEMAIFLPTNDRRADPVEVVGICPCNDPSALPIIAKYNTRQYDIVMDNWGSLYRADSMLSSFLLDRGDAVSVPYFGPAAYGVDFTPLAINEFAISFVDYATQYGAGKILTVGDRLQLSGSSYDGAHYLTSIREALIDGVSHVIFATSSVFTATGTGTLVVGSREDSTITLSKMAPVLPYTYADVYPRELSTDQIYGLISRPSNEIVLWNDANTTSASDYIRHTSNFLTSAGIISLLSNTLTWTSDIIVEDPLRYKLTIQSGSISIVNDEVLFTYLPKITPILVDSVLYETTLRDVLGLSVGMRMFAGDSDSVGTEFTITAINNSTITSNISLADYHVDRGAYVVPVTGTLYKETRNTGVLRPDSQGNVDQTIFVVAYRTSDLVYFRNGALTLQDAEEGHLGEGPTEDLLTYIGAVSEVDPDPSYINNYGGMQGENLTSRLGAVDLRTYEAAQDRNITDLHPMALEFLWDSDNETLFWSGDEWRIAVANVGTATVMHTVFTAGKYITLADNEIAYVTIDRINGAGDLTPVVCAQGALPLNKDNRAHLVIARRIGTQVFVGSPIKTVLNSSATSLISQADKTLKLVGGGTWSWIAEALSWTETAYIEHIGLSNARNSIAIGTDTRLALDGDILYIDLNRSMGPASNLTVLSGNIATVAKAPHRVIIARRVGDNVYVGNMQLEPGVSAHLERPYSNQLQLFVGQPSPATDIHDYGTSVYLEDTMSHETALAELDGRIAQFFSMYPNIASMPYYVWIADGTMDFFQIGSSTGCIDNYGDSTISWTMDTNTYEIVVYREGLKQQQNVHYYKGIESNILTFAEMPLNDEKFLVIVTNITTVVPPAEYVWTGDGTNTLFTLAAADIKPSIVVPFDASNGQNDIMVWVAQYRRYQCLSAIVPIPDLPEYHDFIKTTATSIEFQEAPGVGELVVLRTGTLMSTQWADMHWYGNGVQTVFVAGHECYGNSLVRWSSNTTTFDVIVEADGIFLEPNVDYIKSGTNTITMVEIPADGVKISVHGICMQVMDNRLDVYQNGTLIEGAVTKIDFQGPGVNVTNPVTGEVRVTVTGGGGGSAFTMLRLNNTGVTIPAFRAVCFLAGNEITLADNTISGRMNPTGITLEAIDYGSLGQIAFGGLIEGALTGFNWGDEVFLGLDGALVNEATIPNTGSPLDAVVKLGDVSGTDLLPTDMIWAKERVGGF